MSKRLRVSKPLESQAARRLVQTLAEPGAHAVPSEVKDDMIEVLAPKNGVTAVLARVSAQTVEYARSRGLVRWDDPLRRSKLRLTEAGRAHVRRESAGSNVNRFRAQHSRIARRATEKGAPPALFNEGESPLAWLARRKGRDGAPFLTLPLLEAGERFRRDVTQAQILQRVTANWEASVASSRRGVEGGARVSDIAIDANRRLSRAWDSVGPELAGLLIDVCGYLKGLEAVERERGWPSRSAKVVLKVALERLADHYGLAGEARGPEGGRATLHWGDADYRPSIDPEESKV
jgi:hypothetical protein